MKTTLKISFESSPNLLTYLHTEIKKLVESKGATNIIVERES